MATEEELALRREELEYKKAQTAQKSKESDAASGPAGIIGTILSMGSSIGGMIPSLRKSSQNAELEKYQRGQGAGASMARQTASEAARRVVGASGGRGGAGNIRAGLRTAEDITARGAQQAAITASREGLMATQMLRQNEQVRRNAIRTLGAGVGQGLAGISGMLAASRDQGPVQPGQGTDVLPGEQALLESQGMVTQTPGELAAVEEGRDQADVAATIQGGQAGLSGIQDVRGEGPPTPGTGRFSSAGGIGGVMQDARQQGADSLQEPDAGAVQAQQVANEQAINLQELAQTTADKQDAADAYLRAIGDKPTLVSPNTRTPGFSAKEPWRTDAEEWAYGEAENYNPMMQLGLHPEQVGLMILDWGGVPDWERLGVPMDMGGKGVLK
jgi:hypothetical protein